MGNLAITTPDLDQRDERTDKIRRTAIPPRLQLISKPLLVAQPVPDRWLVTSLFCDVYDALFPKQLPPLKLTSQPVPVADPLAIKRGKGSSITSAIVHAGIIAGVVWLALHVHTQIVTPKHATVTPIEFRPFIPVTLPTPKPMGGGGGGGMHQVIEPSRGHLPPIVKTQIAPPQLLVVDHPKLAVQQAVAMPKQVKIPDTKMPNIGIPQSTQIAVAAQGLGDGSGFGQGSGGGIGSGNGNGIGMGSGGGYGGGVMSVGGGVSAPQVIRSVDPEFTDEARRAKLQGSVSIRLIVDRQGNPQDVQVVHPLGMGLDEKAVEAVRQYKFSPAMYQGHPVAVQMIIRVNFHLY
jgi:periplasmic protein TonB